MNSALTRRFFAALNAAILCCPQALAADNSNDPVRIVLVGDSTVKNGSGRGEGGMWGWGQALAEHVRPEAAVVENRALGGRSSRTYLTEGLWERSLERLRPGDFVLIQFGHNDGGQLFEGDRPRASLKGNGDETEQGTVAATGKAETVHSYGWYLRKIVADAKARGATAIILSPVPRNMWRAGTVVRADRDYGRWAKEAAEQSGALFVDLNGIIAARYEQLGEETVSRDFFTVADHTHTTEAGARLNAACVAEGIRRLADCPLAEILRPEGEADDGAARRPRQASVRDAYRFHFREHGVADGGSWVAVDDAYDPERGFGFEQLAERSEESRYFSVKLPEGNYRVTLNYGRGDASPRAVKAELRRLMACRIGQTPPRREFTVNIRTPAIGAGGADGPSVRLKDRERGSEAWAWDDRLTLEFCGGLPAEMTVVPEPRATTVFLAGDSTVADQPLEPWGSWGQMLPLFFAPGVAVANHAESGESVRSSVGARRFEKIESLLKRGDYLLIQFGHNDMKDARPGALAEYRRLLADVIARTRDRGATPILVTSMERQTGVENDTLGEYPQTVRELAAAEEVPLIDLHTLSKQLYRALGDDLGAAFQDPTHHTSYGSFLLASCVVAALPDADPGAATRLAEELPEFDLARPPRFAEFAVPASVRWDPAARE